MGKKERSFDPNQAHRKEQKKLEAKKVRLCTSLLRSILPAKSHSWLFSPLPMKSCAMLPDCCCCCLQLKKQRDERKESMLNSDPAALQKEISRLEHQAEFRAEAGANAKRQRKIDELHEVKKEAERRRADQASEFGPPLEQQAAMVQTYTSTGSLDLSAITGQKRKAAAPAQQAALPSSRQPDGPADVSASARAAPAQVPAAQQAAELAAARAAAVFGGVRQEMGRRSPISSRA